MIYQRVFVIENVAQTHRAFLQAIRAARAAQAAGRGSAARASVAQLERAYREFNADLRALAVKTAKDSERFMKQRFDATRVRSNTQLQPHLRALLKSRPAQLGGPFETGAVGVADEQELDKAINPTAPQYGTYWIAQEFGTGTSDPSTGITVPGQTGRVIRGYFYGPGLSNPTRPLAQYAGGGGPHPIFVSAKSAGAMYGSVGGSGGGGSRGGKGGFGTIAKEITPRHFIRDGADLAAAEWHKGVRNVDNRVAANLRRFRP